MLKGFAKEALPRCPVSGRMEAAFARGRMGTHHCVTFCSSGRFKCLLNFYQLTWNSRYSLKTHTKGSLFYQETYHVVSVVKCTMTEIHTLVSPISVLEDHLCVTHFLTKPKQAQTAHSRLTSSDEMIQELDRSHGGPARKASSANPVLVLRLRTISFSSCQSLNVNSCTLKDIRKRHTHLAVL